jgi:hypothetical protein
MADLQHIPPSLERRQLIEVIEQEQQKAWKKLRDAGVSEAQALAMMPRIRSYCMYALNEYDQAYMVIEEMVARDGRSLEHANLWLIRERSCFGKWKQGSQNWWALPSGRQSVTCSSRRHPGM